jgi:hypothetical protein
VKIDLVGGPLCGTVMNRTDLPDEVMLIYRPNPQASDRVVYRRVADGRANPWRYEYIGLEVN